MEEEKKTIELWKDGEYGAKGGYYIRNNLKDFFQKLMDNGLEPVGIQVDMESYTLEVIVKHDE